MKHNRLLKALEKLSTIEVVKDIYDTDTNTRYEATNGEWTCSWRVQEGNAMGVYLHKSNMKDDLTSDYFCGWFPKTIKKITDYFKGEYI